MVPAAQLQRVKRFDQQGQEELETSDIRTFQAAAQAAAQASLDCSKRLSRLSDDQAVLSQAADTGAALAQETDDATPQPAAATPREVIEKLAAAKVIWPKPVCHVTVSRCY